MKLFVYLPLLFPDLTETKSQILSCKVENILRTYNRVIVFNNVFPIESFYSYIHNPPQTLYIKYCSLETLTLEENSICASSHFYYA